MYNNINFFTNNMLLTNIITFKFLIMFILIINIFFFTKTNNIIKKLINTIINLLFLTFLIILKSNEAFAYLLLVTELTGILVITPIILSKSDFLTKKNNLNFNIFFIIISITSIIKILLLKPNKNYLVFIDNIKDNNVNFNDLYNLFIILNYNHNLQVFFITLFLVLNMIIILSVLNNKIKQSKINKHHFLKKNIHNIIFDSYKKYYDNQKTIFKKFKN